MKEESIEAVWLRKNVTRIQRADHTTMQQSLSPQSNCEKDSKPIWT